MAIILLGCVVVAILLASICSNIGRYPFIIPSYFYEGIMKG